MHTLKFHILFTARNVFTLLLTILSIDYDSPDLVVEAGVVI